MTTKWESKQFGDFTLWRLEPQANGEERWSFGVHGPGVYLTCDEATAVGMAQAYADTHVFRDGTYVKLA